MLAKGERILVPIAHVHIRAVRLAAGGGQAGGGRIKEVPVAPMLAAAPPKEAQKREAELAAEGRQVAGDRRKGVQGRQLLGRAGGARQGADRGGAVGGAAGGAVSAQGVRLRRAWAGRAGGERVSRGAGAQARRRARRGDGVAQDPRGARAGEEVAAGREGGARRGGGDGDGVPADPGRGDGDGHQHGGRVVVRRGARGGAPGAAARDTTGACGSAPSPTPTARRRRRWRTSGGSARVFSQEHVDAVLALGDLGRERGRDRGGADGDRDAARRCRCWRWRASASPKVRFMRRSNGRMTQGSMSSISSTCGSSIPVKIDIVSVPGYPFSHKGCHYSAADLDGVGAPGGRSQPRAIVVGAHAAQGARRGRDRLGVRRRQRRRRGDGARCSTSCKPAAALFAHVDEAGGRAEGERINVGGVERGIGGIVELDGGRATHRVLR